MTSPGGHPDWQDYANWRGPAFNASNVAVSLASPYSLIVTGTITNFNAIHIMVRNITGAGIVVLLNYQTGALVGQQKEWRAIPGQSIDVILPTLGSTLVIQVTSFSAGTQHCDLQIVPVNSSVVKPEYQQTGNYVANSSLSIPASSSASFVLPSVMEGEGYLWAIEGDVANKINVSLNELDDTGAVTDAIFFIPGISGTIPTVLRFQSGPRPIQINLVNTDGAAPHSVGYMLRVLSQ